MTMVGDTTLSTTARRVHWSGILAGAVMAVMVQILLTLLGLGVGVLSFDRPAEATTTAWVAFAWWAVSGIIAAFVGGWFAGKANAGEANGTMQGLGAWAVSALLVIVGAGVAATGTAGVLSNVAGPVMSNVIGEQTAGPQSTGGASTTGAGSSMNTPPTQNAKAHLGSVMLASFVVLILGAIAGLLGGQMGAASGNPAMRRLT